MSVVLSYVNPIRQRCCEDLLGIKIQCPTEEPFSGRLLGPLGNQPMFRYAVSGPAALVLSDLNAVSIPIPVRSLMRNRVA